VQDSGWEPTQRSARLGKRQASIPAEALDILRGRGSLDLGGAGSSSGALYGAHAAGAYRYGAADAGGALDGGDSSFSTRYGDSSAGDYADSQLDGSPAVQGYQTSLQLPRSPMDFGGIGAEAGRLHSSSGGLRQQPEAGAAHASGAVPLASRGAPQHTASKTRRDAALAAYVATQLGSGG
jgi:hypothetical protein